MIDFKKLLYFSSRAGTEKKKSKGVEPCRPSTSQASFFFFPLGCARIFRPARLSAKNTAGNLPTQVCLDKGKNLLTFGARRSQRPSAGRPLYLLFKMWPLGRQVCFISNQLNLRSPCQCKNKEVRKSQVFHLAERNWMMRASSCLAQPPRSKNELRASLFQLPAH